MASVYLFL